MKVDSIEKEYLKLVSENANEPSTVYIPYETDIKALNGCRNQSKFSNC